MFVINMEKSDSELLGEMAKWLKVMGIQEVIPLFNDIFDFDDDEKERSAKIVYELTNGRNGQRDIEAHIEYSYDWVSRRQQEWANYGLVEKDNPNSPYRHIVSLPDVGIEVPANIEKIQEEIDANEGN